LTYRPARLLRLAESVPWHRFLGSLNVYKYGLWPGIFGFGLKLWNKSNDMLFKHGVTETAILPFQIKV
jgi:hypothetical protein